MAVSSSDADLDLSPRPAPARSPRRQRNWVAIGVLVAVVAAGALILTRFLGSAIDYYCNADEVGVRNGCEEGRRLRVQGAVDEGSVTFDRGVTTFTITFSERTIPVRYEGEPGGIFAECEPVVVHGRLVDGLFHGDNIEVKHSNEYEAQNPDRMTERSPACEAAT